MQVTDAEIAQAKAILRHAGYHIDMMWSVKDVKCLFGDAQHIDDDVCHQILNAVFGSEHFGQTTNESIENEVNNYLKKNNLLKRTYADLDENSQRVCCPHCTDCEGMGIDDPRHRFDYMPVIHWYPDTDAEGANEISVHKCGGCDEEFEVEWDYNRIEKDEDNG